MTEVSIILPAYNEEGVIGDVVERIKSVMKDNDYEIIVVDDGSQDRTGTIARDKGARVIEHPYNIGNGAAIKTGLRNATGKYIVMMDSDGQHDPKYIPEMLERLKRYHMVVGSRARGHRSSFHRYLANKCYNLFASYITNRKIRDLTSGFRAIRTDIAKNFIYILPNSFSYPTTLTLALFRSGYSIDYMPIEVYPRVGKSKINLLVDGVHFVLIMVKIATFFSPLRIFIPASLLSFAGGFAHIVYKVFIRNEQYTGFSLLLITTGLIIGLLGLISEQIAQLRFEKSEQH